MNGLNTVERVTFLVEYPVDKLPTLTCIPKSCAMFKQEPGILHKEESFLLGQFFEVKVPWCNYSIGLDVQPKRFDFIINNRLEDWKRLV